MTSEEYAAYQALKRRKHREGLTDKEAAKYAKLKTKRATMKEKEERNTSKAHVAIDKLNDATKIHAINTKLKATRARSEDDMVDPEELAQQILDSGMDVNVLNKDLSDMSCASNVIEWVQDPRFMAYPTTFAWQMQTLVRLFSEWCTECTDPEWVKPIIGDRDQTKYLPIDAGYSLFLERVQLYEFGICPRCKGKRNEQHSTPNYELVACVGQRAGKSVVIGLASTYVMHRFLNLRNPSATYKLTPGQPLYMTFVSYTLQQAIETVWDAFSAQYAHSPWFKAYNHSLVELAEKQGMDSDLLFRSKDTYIWYGNKMLTAAPAAADTRSLRGRTRLLAAIDELGWFGVGDAVKANGKDTMEALLKSLQTLRSRVDSTLFAKDPNALTSYMLNASSPSSHFDPIMSRLKDAEKDPAIVQIHLPTWEANPDITRKSMRGAEATNYTDFMRDFGAMPPLTDSAFMENEKLIDRCVYAAQKPIFRYKTEQITDAMGGHYIGVKLLDIVQSQIPHIIVADAGESGNSFAVGVFHLEKGDDNIADYVVVDGLVEIAPEKSGSGDVMRVHFPSVFELIIALCEKLYVRGVFYDRWQSSGEIQRLNDKKIKSDKYSPVSSDFTNLRNRVYAGGLKVPRMEKESVHKLDLSNPQDVRLNPITHFVLQMKTVRASGNRVIKPIAGEDDMFRTLVSAAALMEEHRKDYLTDMNLNPNLRGAQRTLGSVYRKSSTGMGGAQGPNANKFGVLKSRSNR